MPTTALPTSDPWAGFNHKAKMETADRTQEFPRWVPGLDRRRLVAYSIIDAYASNNARTLLATTGADTEREDAWQEHGDAGLLLQRIADGVVGEEPAVSILGADAPLAEGPDFPDEPPEPVQGRMSDRAFARRMQIYDRQLEVWEGQVLDAADRWEEDIAAQPELTARQDWLRGWAEDDGFVRNLVESEKRHVVKYGSGVYTVSWDEDRQRPTVDIYSPAAYFPVLGDEKLGEFPAKVHLAWGITELDKDGKPEEWVRRITYELVRRDELPDGFEQGVRPGYLQGDTEEEWTHVVLMSDGRWRLKDLENATVRDLDSKAVWKEILVDGEFVQLRNYALGYDFIPLVHVTHDLASQTHYGTSPLALVAQLLDELQANDTDESMAARRVARPPMIFKGMAQEGGRTAAERALNNQVNVSPGKGWKTSADGGIDYLKMSEELIALMDRTRRYLKRLSVNSSVSEGLIGRVDASEVPSGFALTLSFTSFEQMIEGARLAREASYRLLLKMVQRLQVHHAGGFEGTFVEDDQGNRISSTEIYPAEVTFGNFMPQDLAGTVEIVARAVAAHTMSIETAIEMGEAAGIPVEDMRAELAAILSQWPDYAEAVATSTGDAALAAAILGFVKEPDEEEPEVEEVQPAGTDLATVGAPAPEVNGEAPEQ